MASEASGVSQPGAGSNGAAVTAHSIDADFLIVAAIIAQFGTAMRRKRLDEVSP